MRNKEVDDYLEQMFGKPDPNTVVIQNGVIHTRMSGCPELIRVDEIEIKINKEEKECVHRGITNFRK
jgi:hypothetical protein